ncbi:unnamed protein product [Allacma fusca]|uniref:Fucosyltransferase n=1 Tax=Allacma fusca TaxID=39272 RepID=A0A8J2PIE9_9HEXA|nr:unnamed protein product [Allacma fusca]
MFLDRSKFGIALICVITLLLLLTYRFIHPETFTHLFHHHEDLYRGTNKSIPLTHNNITILFWTPIWSRPMTEKNIPCGNIKCRVTPNRHLLQSSQAVVFHGWESDMIVARKGTREARKNIPEVRHYNQYWVLLALEPPMYFSPRLQSFGNLFNWTMTYRSDSDIHLPYGKFQKLEKPIPVNGTEHLAKRKKLVSLVLSNCNDVPSKRLRLIKELQKYVKVDVYGKCGTFQCKERTHAGCKQQLGNEYKFYLSFENSVCEDYITEKIFQAYGAQMVPIVFGGGNYDRIVPPGSYININEFPTAKSLADYLLLLNSQDEKYLQYFEWKKNYILKADYIGYDTGYCQMCQKIALDFPSGKKSIIPNITDFMLNFQGGQPRCWSSTIWQ